MKKLFEVELDYSFGSDYRYYVLAENYNEAVKKVEEQLEILSNSESIIGSDGSLKIQQKENKVRTVRLLTENLIE